jgi:dTDP-L-rhamnose 4-epimerase
VKKVIVASSQAVLGEGLYRCAEHGDMQPDIRTDEQLGQGHWEHSCAVCGEILTLHATPEKWINPCNPYALSKHSEESIALNLGRRYSIPSVALRYSIVQGPRQSFYNAYSGAMRIFALHLLFDRSPTIYEDGGQIRDYVNIQDVVDANLLVLDDERADYRVFNVGGGVPLTVREFYAEMLSVTDKQIEPKIGTSYRFGDTRHILSDVSALAELGWKPRRNVTDSIAAYWAYLNEQTDIDDILEHAEKTMQSLTVVRNVSSDT